ncbi:hypothetical protein [Clavibacter tessellarius]|uniref:hypothetical protein n=1 Tax=Clavibacter tessellarius TaxID=31965 RepID=UPI003249CFF3
MRHKRGRRVALRGRMGQRVDIARNLREFSRRIYQDGQNSDIILMNAVRYDRGDYKRYQLNQRGQLSLRGELFVGGELGGLKHDGLEVLSRRSAPGYPDALEMLFVPFDRIQWVDLDGDENFNRVIAYVTFMGIFPAPESVSYPVSRKSYKPRDDGPEHFMRLDGAPVLASQGPRSWGRGVGRWRCALTLDLADRRGERLRARQERQRRQG